jgi:hypothetical protein
LIEGFRAVLQAFAGLELVEVDVDVDMALPAFGPGGDRWMHLYEQHLLVAGADGAPPVRFERDADGRFPEATRTAATARIGTLLGRRLSSIEHGAGHRLTLRFAGGGAVGTLPDAPMGTARLEGDGGLDVGSADRGRIAPDGSATDALHVWTVVDGGTGQAIAALLDGSLAPHDAYMNGALAPETGVRGTLGLLRPAPYRPPRPLETPRQAPRGVASGVLGGLAGRSLTDVVTARPDGLILRFAPAGSVKAESCEVTIDDGAARVRHHRRWNGAFAGRDVVAAGLTALAGRVVEAVALEETTLSVALSGGVRLTLAPGRLELTGWRLTDHVAGRSVASVPGLADGGPDGGAAALSVLPDDTRLVAPGATGGRGDDRVLDGRAWSDDASAAVLGARVVAVAHHDPGTLVLRFDDGHRLVAGTWSTVIAVWSASLGRDGPWIAATYDGVIRAMAADAERADAPRTLSSGSLGTLPAYGFKS